MGKEMKCPWCLTGLMVKIIHKRNPLDPSTKNFARCVSCLEELTVQEYYKLQSQSLKARGKGEGEMKEYPNCSLCVWAWESQDTPIYCRLGLDMEKCEGPK